MLFRGSDSDSGLKPNKRDEPVVKKRRKKVVKKSEHDGGGSGKEDDDKKDKDGTDDKDKKDKDADDAVDKKKKKKKKTTTLKKKGGGDDDDDDSGSDVDKKKKGDSADEEGGVLGFVKKAGRRLSTTGNNKGQASSDAEEENAGAAAKKPPRRKKASSSSPAKKKKDKTPQQSSDSDDDDDDRTGKNKSAPKVPAGSAAGGSRRSVTLGKYTFNLPTFFGPSSSDGGGGTNRLQEAFGKLRDYTLPRPEFYKRLMRRRLPLKLGLRPLPVPEGGGPYVPPKALPRNYAGCEVDDVLSILVTGMDNLVDDPIVVHPLVRIHVVDVNTGRYLQRVKRKGQKFESATTQFERQTVFPLQKETAKRQANKKLNFIPPVCTLPWRLSGVRGANPQWQEQVHILESYTTILNHNALILIEVLDFGPTVPIKEAREGGGYHRIAWGFLKTRGANDQFRVGVREWPKNIKKDANVEYSDYSRELLPSQKICRLQLYKYKTDNPLIKSQSFYRNLPAFIPPPLTPEVPPVFLQYLRQSRDAYPSSITLIIGPVPRPRTQVVLRRALLPWEQERHRMKFQELATNAQVSSLGIGSHQGASALSGGSHHGGSDAHAASAEALRRGAMQRMRRPTEQCALPDRLLHRLPGGSMGALVIKFNGTGTLLACATSGGDMDHRVRLYDTETGAMRHEYAGHHSLIYDLQWSSNDRFLVSASADGTAKVWSTGSLCAVEKKKEDNDEPEDESGKGDEPATPEVSDDENADPSKRKDLSPSKQGGARSTKKKDIVSPHLVVTLQHHPPVYCYCAAFQPPPLGSKDADHDETGPLVMTGAFDSSVRMWDPATGKDLGLLGGKRHHESHVNAMVFDPKTGRLYTGDGIGCIIIWRKGSQGRATQAADYLVMRKIDKLKEFMGHPITSLALNPARPTGRGHLLIYAQQSTLRTFDLGTHRLTVANFSGVDNHSSVVRATFSPDGRYVIAGNDKGGCSVWDSKTGYRIWSPVDSINYSSPLNSVCWHPTQHVIAVASYGGGYPVLLYSADHDPSKAAAQAGSAGAAPEEEGSAEPAAGGALDDETAAREALARREALEEKRARNREKYADLKDKALQRKMGGTDD